MTAKQTFFSTDLEKALDNTLKMIKTFVGKVEEKCSTAVKKRRKREFTFIFYGSKSILLQKKRSIAKIFFDYSIRTKLRPVDAIIQIEHANLFDNV